MEQESTNYKSSPDFLKQNYMTVMPIHSIATSLLQWEQYSLSSSISEEDVNL
jgi:hypothetical protein